MNELEKMESDFNNIKRKETGFGDPKLDLEPNKVESKKEPLLGKTDDEQDDDQEEEFPKE